MSALSRSHASTPAHDHQASRMRSPKATHQEQRSNATHATEVRHAIREGALQSPHGHRRTSLRQSPEQGHAKIHASWSKQSECPVEAVRDGAQHREVGRPGTAPIPTKWLKIAIQSSSGVTQGLPSSSKGFFLQTRWTDKFFSVAPTLHRCSKKGFRSRA